MSKSSIVYSEEHADFKYQQIIKNLDIEYRKYKYSKFIVYLLMNICRDLTSDQKIFYHIRYLKWRGYFLTMPIYIILVLLCWIKGIKITWTCHNLREHKFRSKLQNWLLRHFVYFFSDHVIVMHADLIKYLPGFRRDKIKVANFGDLRLFFEDLAEENKDFQRRFEVWKNNTGRYKIDLLYVSTAKTDLSLLLKKMNGQFSASIIAPGNHFQNQNENVFLYTEKPVRAEVRELLFNKDVVGLVLHDNISVPTSIYMFASYGIPILGYDVEPVNSIIQENQIGEVFNDDSNLDSLISGIKTNYDFYQKNIHKFLQANSWGKAAAVHKKIWCY